MINASTIKLFLNEEDDRYQYFDKKDQDFIAALLVIQIEDLLRHQDDHNKIIRLYEQSHSHLGNAHE